MEKLIILITCQFLSALSLYEFFRYYKQDKLFQASFEIIAMITYLSGVVFIMQNSITDIFK